MRYGRAYDEPAMQEGRVRLQGTAAGISTNRDILSLKGRWSAVDFWFRGLFADWNPVPFRLWAIQGQVYQLIRQQTFGLIPDIQIDGAGVASARVFQIRGCKCDGFVVSADSSAVVGYLSEAYARLETWGEDATCCSGGPWGQLLGNVEYGRFSMVPGDNIIIAGVAGRRLVLAGIEISSDDPAIQQVAVLDDPPAAPQVPIKRFMVTQDAPTVCELTVPIPLGVQSDLVFNLSGRTAGATIHGNAHGYWVP